MTSMRLISASLVRARNLFVRILSEAGLVRIDPFDWRGLPSEKPAPFEMQKDAAPTLLPPHEDPDRK